MRIFLAPLAFVLAFAAPQEPKVQDPPVQRPGGFESEAVKAARTRESLLGAWQLTRAEIPDLGVAAGGGGIAGYMLLLEGYMSIEIHVIGNTSPDSPNTFFQSGTHRWKLDDNGTLETFGLIGTHNITDDEEYDFEEPGLRRAYKVRFDGERLVLERADRTSRFTFTRLGKLRYPDGEAEPELDFFGRPIKPKDSGKKKDG